MKDNQIYLANLAVLNMKVHNLHWNVVGSQFVQIHQFTEELYTTLFEQLDESAELLKMRGVYPEASMKAYLSMSTVSELESKSYTVKEVLEILKSDLMTLVDLATQLRLQAIQKDDFRAQALYEEFIAGYEKNIWFISSIQA